MIDGKIIEKRIILPSMILPGMFWRSNDAPFSSGSKEAFASRPAGSARAFHTASRTGEESAE